MNDSPVSTGLPAAVLFDLDGLLVDSEPVWYDAERAIVERLGGTWSREHQAAIAGGLIAAGSAYIVELTGTAVSVATVQEELLGAMIERYAAAIPLHAGAVELIEDLTRVGIPLGVVSSSYRVLVDAALVHFDPATFAVTVSGDEVEQGKPHPEPYLTACRRLGVPPARSVVLEDSRTGVASAEAAGCPVIAVPEHATIEHAPGRRVVRSLRQVDLGLLAEVVCERSGLEDGQDHDEARAARLV